MNADLALKIVNDKDPSIRLIAAQSGWGIDHLINDRDESVLIQIATMGIGYEQLINHTSPDIRAVVARGVFDEQLNKQTLRDWITKNKEQCALVENCSTTRKLSFVQNGLFLDKLIYDKSPVIKQAIVNQGLALDVLFDDDDQIIKSAVNNYLLERKLTLEQWIEDNPDKCIHKTNRDITDSDYPAADTLNLTLAFESLSEISKVSDEQRRLEGNIDQLTQGYIKTIDDIIVKNKGIEKIRNFGQTFRNMKMLLAKRGINAINFSSSPDEFIRAEAVKYLKNYLFEEKDDLLRTLAVDRSFLVRMSVIENDHSLDLLIDDINDDIAQAAKDKLESAGISQWIERNPEKCALVENRASIDWYVTPFKNEDDVKQKDIMDKKNIEFHKTDPSPYIRKFIVDNIDDDALLMSMSGDRSLMVRLSVASKGLCLDSLINDPDRLVVNKVKGLLAKEGKSIKQWIFENPNKSTLINSVFELSDYDISEYISKGEFVEYFVHSKNVDVRSQVAGSGLYSSTLIHDEDEQVREYVANSGYGLDYLINDSSENVKARVAERLRISELTMEEWIMDNLDKCHVGVTPVSKASDVVPAELLGVFDDEY